MRTDDLVQKNNAKCKICGQGYVMCLSCKEYSRLHPYQLHTDTAEHFKIYQVLHGYTTGIYSKNEARERLLNIDLSDMNTYRDKIKSRIGLIMERDKENDSGLSESNGQKKKPATRKSNNKKYEVKSKK